jgi:hypothetical protein
LLSGHRAAARAAQRHSASIDSADSLWFAGETPPQIAACGSVAPALTLAPTVARAPQMPNRFVCATRKNLFDSRC